MKIKRSFGLVGAALVGALLGGCANHEDGPQSGGGGGGGGASGPVTVAITDVASDEIVSCTVEITSIHLHGLNGSDVTVLSLPVRVDLASLADVSRVVASVNVPAGIYTEADITVDFGGAQCFLVGHGSGAAIVGTDGLPITGSFLLPLQLDSPMTVTVNGNQLIELDFDLDQSFLVDEPGNTVVLEPAFFLHVNRTTPKPLLVTATLDSVNTTTMVFVGTIHSIGGGSVSTVNFHASNATVYQIDGVSSTGAAGLSALNLAGAGTVIECFGSVSSSSTRIEVTSCLAGSGALGSNVDVVEGHVVDRSGGPGSDAVLTVLGSSDNATHDTQVFATAFIVNTTFANTKVVRTGSGTAYDADDLNVGQRVRVFGTLTGTTLDATSITSVAILDPTRVTGTSNGTVGASTLTMNATFVDELPASAFTWTDGGLSPPDPTLFRADVGTLGNGLAIVAGTNVSVKGFFTDVSDPGVDLHAFALSNVDTGPVLLLVRNDPAGGLTVGVTTTTTLVQLAISGAALPGETAVIDRGQAGSVPLPTAPTPTLAHGTSAGSYSLRDRSTGAMQVYTQFSDFASALGSTILQGATLVQIGAHGTYNAGTNILDATSAAAVIE